MANGPGDVDPADFGGTGHSVTYHDQDGQSGWEHHTVHDSDGNRFSWDEVDYTDSNGESHHDVANEHYHNG